MRTKSRIYRTVIGSSLLYECKAQPLKVADKMRFRHPPASSVARRIGGKVKSVTATPASSSQAFQPARASRIPNLSTDYYRSSCAKTIEIHVHYPVSKLSML